MSKISRSTTLLLLLILTANIIHLTTATVESTSITITVPDEYESIQEAINIANPGDTILVKNGTYHEHIVINKTITLAGADQSDTIIDGDEEQYIPIILINRPNVTVINFTIRNTSTEPETYGILISNTENTTIRKNIIEHTYRGIMINNSTHCNIIDNLILRNYAYALSTLPYSSHNTFANNTIMENPSGVTLEPSCQKNMFYNNYFINNILQVQTFEPDNEWNNNYPVGGNYWSDYTGVDNYSGPNQNENGSDGIGDTPYTKFGVADNYPLMHPHVPIQPVANFTHTPETAVKNESITFNASASYDVDGYIVSYEWDFGDGNITVQAVSTIIHAYASYGNYSVKLTVTDNETLTDSTTKTIFVRKKISTLGIQVNPSTIQIGQSTIINGTLLIEGNPSSAKNITIHYRVQNQTDWIALNTTDSNVEGTYTYNWTPTVITVYDLQAMWEGNDTTLPTSSVIAELTVVKWTSNLTINADPMTTIIGTIIAITGQLTPVKEGANVTITYFYEGNWTWNMLIYTQTDSNGEYYYDWTPPQSGLYILNASWPGDETTMGSKTPLIYPINVNRMPSEITIRALPENATTGSNVTLSGKITPARTNVNVTIQINIVNGTGSWSFTVMTDADGNYTYIWKPQYVGTYEIKASWPGDKCMLSAESELLTVKVDPRWEAPPIYYYVIAITLILIVLAIVILKARKGRNKRART